MTIYSLPKILVLEGCYIEPHALRKVIVTYPGILQSNDEGFAEDHRLERGVTTVPISTNYFPSRISSRSRKTPWGYYSIFANLNLENL